MSQVVSDPQEIRDYSVVPLSSELPRAVLVEAFNRILVSKISFAGEFTPAITVFEEKEDLLPFEEAKLYGHNASQLLRATWERSPESTGSRTSAACRFGSTRPRGFHRGVSEALIKKHNGVDPLFTRVGYGRYVDDLIARMMNPLLRDTPNG